MRYEITLLTLLIGIMILSLVLHFAYLGRIKAEVSKTADSKFEEKDLESTLQIPQGSNFNTLVLSAWSLFFVALVLLYFLTPTIFPAWNYFRIPRVASSDVGLIILGLGVILVMGLLAFNIPKVYRYYVIPRNMKEVIIYIAPLLLVVSVFASAYLGTIYPKNDNGFWNLSYVALFAAQLLLFLPIISGFLEGFR